MGYAYIKMYSQGQAGWSSQDACIPRECPAGAPVPLLIQLPAGVHWEAVVIVQVLGVSLSYPHGRPRLNARLLACKYSGSEPADGRCLSPMSPFQTKYI